MKVKRDHTFKYQCQNIATYEGKKTKDTIINDKMATARHLSLKGCCHQLNIFWKGYKIKSVLSVHAQMVFKFLACLVQE
jgi:hypothetical protein